VTAARFKERLMWATYVLAWGCGVLFAGSIFSRSGWLNILGAGVLFLVACGGAHHTHEMHLSDPEQAPEPDRFRKPDGPRRD
jgi:hypothetical protein